MSSKQFLTAGRLTQALVLAVGLVQLASAQNWLKSPSGWPYNWEQTLIEHTDVQYQANYTGSVKPVLAWQVTLYRPFSVTEMANNGQAGVPWSDPYDWLDPNGQIGFSVFGPQKIPTMEPHYDYTASEYGFIYTGAECWVDTAVTPQKIEWRQREQYYYDRLEETSKFMGDDPEGPGG